MTGSMGEVLKFPKPMRRYRRVRQKERGDDPNQLDLFPPPTAEIADFTDALSPFQRALLLDEREDPRAKALYVLAIESEDCAADAYCNLGIIESRQGNRAQAFDCFTKALKCEPRHCHAHYNLASLYFELKDHRLAQVHYEMAAQCDPEFANVHFNLALVRSVNGDHAGALQSLETFKRLAPAAESKEADALVESLKAIVAANRKGSRAQG